MVHACTRKRKPWEGKLNKNLLHALVCAVTFNTVLAYMYLDVHGDINNLEELALGWAKVNERANNLCLTKVITNSCLTMSVQLTIKHSLVLLPCGNEAVVFRNITNT